MIAIPRFARDDRGAFRTLGAVGPLIALLAAGVFFATRSDRFLTGDNLSIVLQQVMVVGVIAIGQTLVILTAGVDLSCGTVMALGGIVMTKLAVVMLLASFLIIFAVNRLQRWAQTRIPAH